MATTSSSQASQTSSTRTRRIAHRTTGHRQGPITRLMSPGDIGELVKPFVFLDYFEFPSAVKTGLPVHPHSGIATHTTLLQGSVDYADSTGKSGTLSPRSIEWMQAGGGVWHGGGPSGGEALRGFQLWVALPPALELAKAASDYVDGDAVPTDGEARLLLGSYRQMASTIAYQEPVTYLHVKLQHGQRWTYRAAPSHDIAWLAVATGGLLVDNASLHREMAVFEEGNAPIEVVAQGDVEFVIASATKHPFPLVTGHYSVHTTREALVRGEAGYAAIAKTMTLKPGQPIERRGFAAQ
jgi:redox-sensitive bicupin YhaK (pirin superfamily)